MKQAKTTKQPLEDSKEYVITENLADHVGYTGEPVTIFKKLPDDYYLVRNAKGQLWQVGEEEIKEHSKEGLHTQKPNFETLHIGLCSNDEDLQLINELGEHILTIESYPLKGIPV